MKTKRERLLFETTEDGCTVRIIEEKGGVVEIEIERGGLPIRLLPRWWHNAARLVDLVKRTADE